MLLVRGGVPLADIDPKTGRSNEFLLEAEDALNALGTNLVRLGRCVKAGVIDHTILNSVFRSAHTIKGMAGVFESDTLATLTHSLEDALDTLRLGRALLTEDVMDSLFSAYEVMQRMIEERRKEPGPEALDPERTFLTEIANIKRSLSITLSPHAKGATQADGAGAKKELSGDILGVLTEYELYRLKENLRHGKKVFIVNTRFSLEDLERGYANFTELLKSRSEVIATLPSTKTSPQVFSFDILIASDKGKAELLDIVKRCGYEFSIRQISENNGLEKKHEDRQGRPPLQVIRDADQTVKPRKESLRRSSSSIRVEIAKIESVMNSISDLGVLKTGISDLSARLRNEPGLSFYGIEISRIERHLERKLSELRDSVLDVRMVPVGELFGRYETFLSRLARQSGKEISIVVSGGSTEIDKHIIEELADPLMHIIRNAVDHAIEPPHARESMGKPRAGRITLSAHQTGNHAVIEIRDDGAGIDEDLVSRKAVEKGMVSPDNIKKLSRHDVLELLFAPGFTTRDTVSETSGRGVGMDVVKENITRLGGIIDLATEKGRGTRVVLTIPVTLAIIRAMIVEDGGERYALPLSSAIEIIELRSDSAEDIKQHGVIAYNERDVPCVRLKEFFKGPAGEEEGSMLYGIMVGVAEHRLCIVVKRLVEELDIVIKPLSRTIKAQGIAGAADMGEKGAMLVVDAAGMLEGVNNRLA
mgnify:CR=1 FL=1